MTPVTWFCLAMLLGMTLAVTATVRVYEAVGCR